MYQDFDNAYTIFLEFDKEKWSQWIWERIHGYDSQINIPFIDSELFPESPITDIYDHLVKEDAQKALRKFSRGLKLSLKNDISRATLHYHEQNQEFTEEQIFSLESHLRVIHHFYDQELFEFADNVFRKNFEDLINDIYLDIYEKRKFSDLRKAIISLSCRIDNGLINREVLEDELKHIEVTRLAFNYLLKKEKITSLSTYFPIFVEVSLENDQDFLVQSELNTIKYEYLENFPDLLSEQLSKSLQKIKWQSFDKYLFVKEEIEILGLPFSEQVEVDLPDTNRNDSGISILKRIKLTLSEPPSLFRSYAYFIFRTGKQLGLINNEDDSIKLLEDIFIKAVTTATLIEQFNRFFNKSHFMNNPMVFIRWISYSILLNRATIGSETRGKIDDFDPKKVKMVQYGIWIINKAAGDFKGFGKLEDEIFEDFYILMLRYQQGSNWDMIQRIFMELKNEYIEKETLIRKSKKALSRFREAFHKEFKKFDENINSPEIYPDKKDFVVTYYKLGLKPCLNNEVVPFGNSLSYGNSEDINVIYNLILRSNQNSWLDYWFSEIDHILSHVNNFNQAPYRNRLNDLIKQLCPKIDDHIKPLQSRLNAELQFFGRDSQMQAFGLDSETQTRSQKSIRQEFYDFSTPKYYKLVDEFHVILHQEIGYQLKYKHWNLNSNGQGFVPINCLENEEIYKYDQD